MNRNDLRYIKTEKIIKSTYLSLKKKNPSPIKVSELCRAAMINKSTFYSHYETIEYLHHQICIETIDSLIHNLYDVDSITNDLEAFVIAVIKVLRSNASLLNMLFDSDRNKIVSYVEKSILSLFSTHDELKEKEKEIIFAIGGAANLLITNQERETVNIAIKLIHKTIN